jgi:cobalt-zinc-cadmium efflux system protein
VTVDRRLKVAMALNIAAVVLEVALAWAGHSLSLLSDAGHNLADVGAVALAAWAIRLGRRPPTKRRSFGFHRGRILAAQANAAAIVLVTVLIVEESLRRLAHPRPVTGAVVVAAGVITFCANLVAAWLLREGSGDLNLRSAYWHLAGDAASSLAVAAGGAVMMVTGGNYWLDPALSIAIGCLLAWQAFRLLKGTIDVLMESAPPRLDPALVSAAIAGTQGVQSLHDLHLWSLSDDHPALSAHLVLGGRPGLSEAQVTGLEVKLMLQERFGITHSTLELECEPCAGGSEWLCAMHPSTGDAAGAEAKGRISIRRLHG